MAVTAEAATVSLKGLLSREGRRNPYPHYAELHRHGPVCRLNAPEDRYDLVVHGFDAANEVIRDPIFRVMDSEYPDRRGSSRWREHPALRTLLSSIFFIDGPDHARVRRLFGQVFTQRRVNALAPAITRMIEDYLDRLEDLGADGAEVDFIAEFALPLPSDAIGELLGIPEEHRAWFPRRVGAMSAILDMGSGIWRYQQAADIASVELTEYFTELVATRRADPRDDLVSALVQRRAEGAELSDEELLANLIVLYTAGFVTTTHLFGNGLTLLLERPDAVAALVAEPERTPAYLEEILRFEAPAQFTVRWATADTEIGGVPVAEGSRVLVLYGAANRDPRRFDDPDDFDPMREDNQHLSFSGGLHYCLGAALSRLEGQLALPRLFRRFPRLAVAGTPGTRDKLIFRGYERLPVTIT